VKFNFLGHLQLALYLVVTVFQFARAILLLPSIHVCMLHTI